jgi:PhoPQ-activated pathogenicity-related protein
MHLQYKREIWYILLILVIVPVLITTASASNLNANDADQEKIDAIVTAFSYTKSQLDESTLRSTTTEPFGNTTVKIRPALSKNYENTLKITTRAIMSPDISYYLTEKAESKDSLVNGFGVDYLGYLTILVEDNYSLDELDKIIKDLDSIAKKKDIEPLPIRFATFTVEIGVDTSEPLNQGTTVLSRAVQTDRWRPLLVELGMRLRTKMVCK